MVRFLTTTNTALLGTFAVVEEVSGTSTIQAKFLFSEGPLSLCRVLNMAVPPCMSLFAFFLAKQTFRPTLHSIIALS